MDQKKVSTPIRDAFADLFFPATSTITTRARYFILVPSIYLAVLEQGDSGAGARHTGDRIELAIRKWQLVPERTSYWRLKWYQLEQGGP